MWAKGLARQAVSGYCDPMLRYLLYSALFAIGAAACAHVAVSAFAAYVIGTFNQRIFDVRTFDSPVFPSLIGGYIESQQPLGGLAVGSSFTYGYPYAEDLTFPAVAGVTNVSVLSGDLAMSYHAALCEMKARGIRAKSLILEVPLVNDIYSLVHYNRRPMVCDETVRKSLFAFALGKPIGLGWYDKFADTSTLRERGKDIQIIDVAPGYFASRSDFERVRQELRDRMQANYDLAKEVADEAFLFITPVYVPGIAEAGDDPQKVREQFQFAQAACSEIAGDRCLPTDDFLDRRDLYFNLTHLNADGAQVFGELARQALDD